jgi:hypothetical protein
MTPEPKRKPVAIVVLILTAILAWIASRVVPMVAVNASAADAYADIATAVPAVPTPEWTGETISVAAALAFLDRQAAAYQAGLNAVVHTSDTGIYAVRDVAQYGLATNTITAAMPWCGVVAICIGVLAWAIKKSERKS